MTSKIPSKVLINMTPHNLSVCPEGGSLIFYPKTGMVARLMSKKQKQIGKLTDGSPVFEPQEFNGVIPHTPFLAEGYRGAIVSMPTADWLKRTMPEGWRHCEVYCADTGPEGVIRNENGDISGTRRLVRYI